MAARACAVLLLALVASGGAARTHGGGSGSEEAAGDDWPEYFGDSGRTHYSSLKDINTGNVGNLTMAWTYDTRETTSIIGAMDVGLNSTLESNPLILQGALFFISPKGRLICLDADTGRERWMFDPAGGASRHVPQRSRGVAYWTDGKERRIFFTYKTELLAVDGDSGRPAAGFGSNGRVSLKAGIDRDPALISPQYRSPGTVYKDLIIVGSTGGVPGHIRAFDVRTGALRWTFHTIPRPGEFGYETWPKDGWKTAMGVNNWAGMTLDKARGIVFVPLAAPNGPDTIGDNLFANSLVALDASTGRRIWHFQTIRHDLWDRDLPAPPTLVTVTRAGKRVDAVAQISKAGFVYLLDRTSGKSLFSLVEKPAFPSDIPGEFAAKTQIEPALPKPYARQHLTPNLLTQRTPEAASAVAKEFSTLRSRGLWDPPSEQGTIIFPGLDGGGEWGGGAYDPETGLFYVNANEMAWVLWLRRRTLTAGKSGSALYQDNCAGCHGKNRGGQLPDFPSLIGVADRLTINDIRTMILGGGGRMPAFGSLSWPELEALIGYLRNGTDTPAKGEVGKAGSDKRQAEAYSFDFKKFLDPQGYPAVAPPWGTLSAIDLTTGQYAWQIPFGEYPELAAQGVKNTGSENYGGAVVTAGGLLFIAATCYDNKFRAFDKRTGTLLWETVLPAAGNATPSTYRVKNRQFVVIAAGGGKNIKAPPGSKIVAFSLPDESNTD